MSSTSANSTLEENDTSREDNVKYILVTTLSVAVAFSVAIVLAFIVRACWRKRQGSKQYRPVPTTDYPQNEPVKNPKVKIVLPDPPPPKTRITLATDLATKLPPYLPHKPIATGNSRRNPPGVVGVATPQAFLCLKMCLDHDRLMIEVQNAIGLPCRTDGTPADLFVKLNVVSREKKRVKRSPSGTLPIQHSNDPRFVQTLDCGSVVREELEHTILHIEVLDHVSFSQHVVLAKAEFALNEVREKPAKSFKVPLNIVELSNCPVATFSGHILISLYNDKVSSKLSVTITKVELSQDSPPSSTDYWIKVFIRNGDKCLVKEKTKHISFSSDEIHFNKTIVCHNVSDVNSMSVQCSLVTMATINFMKRPKELGSVTLGSHTQGQTLRHWNDMLNNPNTPIAEWHDLI